MSDKNSLLIPGDFPPVVSGIATYFYEIWNALSPEKCFILAAQDEGWASFDARSRLRIIRRRIPTGDSTKAKILKGLLHTFWTVRLHLRYNFNIIHCGQVLSSGVTGWFMKKIFGVPYIVYVYGSETFRFGHSRLLLAAIKSFLGNAELIIPNSQFTKEEFLALGLPENKFKVITPGVDISRFYPTQKDAELVDRWNLAGKIVLLTVARLDERKGHDNVIAAVSFLKAYYPNLVYLVVGKGREEERLRNMARELEVEDRIRFCGYVSDTDLPKYYNLCDIFMLLNRQSIANDRLRGDYEGFGIVFLEASACGKPVIAGDFGGIADAVEDQKSGFIIDGTRIPIITDQIRQLIASNELRTKIGEYGLQRARQNFNWQTISENIRPLV